MYNYKRSVLVPTQSKQQHKAASVVGSAVVRATYVGVLPTATFPSLPL